MSKTLTEQWRDGEWIVCNVGKCKYYYTDVKCYNGSHKEVIKEESVFLTDYDPDYEILGEVPRYDEIKSLQEQLKEANKLLRYCCANYESSRFGATITEDGEILPKGPVWNYLKKWKV